MAAVLSMQEFDSEFIKDKDFFAKNTSNGPTKRPKSLSLLDVRQCVLEEIALKTLYLCGSLSLLELAEKKCLSYEVVESLFNQMRLEQLCLVTGMTGHVHQIAITGQGRTRAAEFLAQNHYAGPAPVAFESYAEQTRKQTVKQTDINAARMHRAFAHLVIDSETLRKLGTAMNSGSSMFLWGPAGTGKTTIAETLARVLAQDDIWLPYAVEVDGQIITVYDPSIHKRIKEMEPEDRDARWVLCQRPAVLVGGELTAEMLDLQFNGSSKYYVAPAQMKANNGVLIIDDFGRQRLRPEELLNRWVVPLDRRIDFLTLVGGKKIEVPFEMLIVFASNMDPAELIDPAFLRRIQTKIKIGEVSDDQFCEIFRRFATGNNVPFDPSIPRDLIDYIRLNLKQELRSCYPRDILNQVCWAAQYDGRKPHVDRPALKRAVEAFFLDAD